MRIVLVAPPFYPVPPKGYGGIERVCHVLANGLHDRGHDVTVVGVGERGVACRFVATHDEPHPEGTDRDAELEVVHAARAADVIRDLAPDIVHDHTRAGPLTATARREPTVATVHGSVASHSGQRQLVEAWGRHVALVAISSAQRLDAPHLTWRATIPNGVQIDDFLFSAEKDDFVLYLGRLSEDKGVHLAIDAVARAERPLVIAGAATIPSEHRYVEEVIRPRLGGPVEMLGEVGGQQRRELLGRARCLILPALWNEPFGLVLVEAMASGTPVVGFRGGALPDVVADGVTGLLCVEPDDLPAAIEAVGALDPHRCRHHVEVHYSAARMVDSYAGLFTSLVSGPLPSEDRLRGA